MKHSNHALIRAQQRCIPALVVEWLLNFGTRSPSNGALRISFDKRSKRELASEVGKPVVKQLGRFLNAALIVDADTEKVITMMWLH